MSVSSLREITVGVSNLAARVKQFEDGCGLQVLARGPLTSITAGRLFDLHVTPRAALMGRPDVPGSPRLRLVEVAGGSPARAQDLRSPGPLGIGFDALRIEKVRSRLQGLAVEFVPSPPSLTDFGRAEDGDLIVLSEAAHTLAAEDVSGADCSEPLLASFVVTNLDACLHFMRDALEQEALSTDPGPGQPFASFPGVPRDAALRSAMIHRPGLPSGRILFMEFERRLEPMAQTPALSRGLCRLRYDTDDLHETLARVPGGGGALVRGPASIDDPVLGRALVAMVRAPFGVLIELWQSS